MSAEIETYMAAAERFARDPEFHARAVRVEHLVAVAEPHMVEEARFGLRWGAAMALYLVDIGAESPVPPAGTPNATRYLCAFRNCPWTLETSLDAFAGDFIENFELYPSPRVLTRLHNGAIEQTVRAHLVEAHRAAIESLASVL